LFFLILKCLMYYRPPRATYFLARVVSCPLSHYRIPTAIHFLNLVIILYCEDDIRRQWLRYLTDHSFASTSFIIIHSQPKCLSCKKSTDDSKKMNKNCFYFRHTVIYGQRSCPVAPPADCLAAPVNHGGKVNSKDIGMHAQQPINLLRTTCQPCCS